VLGEHIRKARLAAKLTQEELAFKAGISRNYVSLLEKDEKSPTVAPLLRVCKAVGVKASRLLAKVE
jgi:transcriptional regulator with XRE-family HTH domain